MRVEVPALTAAGGPDGARGHAAHLGHECCLRLRAHVNGRATVRVDRVERPQHVLDLGLDHDHDRRVPEPGEGTEQDEQVREAGDRGAVEGGHRALPVLGQQAAVAAADAVDQRLVGDVEAGPEDDRVDRVLDPINGEDRVRAHFTDARVDHLDVRLCERRQVLIGEEDPLAAEAVARFELGPQRGVGHLAREILFGDALEDSHQARFLGEPEDEQLGAPVECATHQLHRRGEALEQAPQARVDLRVAARHDPRRGALIDLQLADFGLDLGDELDGGRARADHRDPLAGERVFVIPLRGVEGGALEGVEALQLGQRRLAQAAHAADQDLGGEVAGRAVDLPQAALFAPGGLEQLVAEADVRRHAVFVGDAFQVGLDLRLGRAQARPVRVERERERVQVRGHVAGAARVAVVAPGPAETRGALEQHEVVLAALLEPDRRAQAGEAGADDHDPVVLGCAHSQVEVPRAGLEPATGLKSPHSAVADRISPCVDRRCPGGQRSSAVDGRP